MLALVLVHPVAICARSLAKRHGNGCVNLESHVFSASHLTIFSLVNSARSNLPNIELCCLECNAAECVDDLTESHPKGFIVYFSS